MAGPFKAFEGEAITPGVSFNVDGNTGFRRSAPNETRWVGGGQDRVTVDANGKMTLLNGIDVTGSVDLSNVLAPHALRTIGQSVMTLRHEENDTSEHELATYESGSGSGAHGSLRVVGGGANDVATMRFYVNNIKVFEWTSQLFSVATDLRVGSVGALLDADGFIDFVEMSAPASPATNIGRFYCRDVSGVSKMFYKDSVGTERGLNSPVDRQVFTSSGIWTKPSADQTTVLIEGWGGGGGGDGTGGGGGGGAYSRRVMAIASLSASVSVAIGAGGGVGVAGGGSSFGSYFNAFGGGTTSGTGAGGGGGPRSVGANGSGPGGAGGLPRGMLGSAGWGEAVLNDDGNSNPFGGGAGGDNAVGTAHLGGAAIWGGGGGGSNGSGGGTGGSSIYGGGGGGGTSGGAGGTSIFGGNGGNDGASGSIPAGGGGTNGGGARGEIRVTCW